MMKRNGLKEMATLAICAAVMSGPAALAQVSGSSENSTTVYAVTSWDDLGRFGVDNGSYVIDRFGVRDGRLVAYGRLVPNSTIVVDERMFGSWTGIGTGYGESGVESRSNMRSEYYAGEIMTLNRSTARSFDLQMGPTSANDRVANGGIDLRFGPTSGNDRVATGIDLRFGPTSANDRTRLDASFGPTSENDRTAIDLKFGPTSGNDRVAGGPIDLHFGPTSENDRTSIDVQMGPTSGNDRTAIDLNLGASSRNDYVAPVLGVSSQVILPVEVVSASCDMVTLSIGAGERVTLTPSASASAETRAALCAVSEMNDATILSAHLNDMVLVMD